MKILITGPESSGKSTLCSELSGLIDGILIPEYARKYLEKNGNNYGKDDLITIAKHHYNEFKIVDGAAIQKTIILDSYLLNIKIWSQVKYGACDPWIIEKLSESNFNLVFLLKPNIPWVDDPLRESKDSRDQLFQMYKDEFEELKWNYFIIDDVQSQRTNQALSIIDSSGQFNTES